jgi:polyisoprenyl-teichoic acid--peptidoglycan teichoic acid transferase
MEETQPYRHARPQHARRERPLGPAPRRRSSRGRGLKLLVLALVALLIAALVVVVQRAATFNAAVSTESAFSLRLFGPFSPNPVNILVLGYSDESREGAFLTDSMNVFSIDGSSDATTVIPIPRDLWVEGMPQVPDNMKINEAFRIGYYADGLANGAELAAEAVTHVTGLPIHGWIALDFQGFEAMVDAVGGITVENPTAFAYTWHEGEWLAGRFEGSFDAGTLALDGEQALTYARNRYTSVTSESSDFARSVRQQRVLQAIRAEITGFETVPKGLAVADALEGHLHTNVSVWDLGLLVGKLDIDRRIELSEDVILRASTNSIGQYVLVVIGQAGPADYTPLHEFVADAMSEPIPTSTPAPTERARSGSPASS